MTPDDIARARRVAAWLKPWNEYQAMPRDPDRPSLGRLDDEAGELLTKALDALEHAISVDGDHLSIASRRMCETVMGDRDALRQRVRDLERTIEKQRPVVIAACEWSESFTGSKAFDALESAVEKYLNDKESA
jgi:hypothetical protein